MPEGPSALCNELGSCGGADPQPAGESSVVQGPGALPLPYPGSRARWARVPAAPPDRGALRVCRASPCNARAGHGPQPRPRQDLPSTTPQRKRGRPAMTGQERPCWRWGGRRAAGRGAGKDGGVRARAAGGLQRRSEGRRAARRDRVAARPPPQKRARRSAGGGPAGGAAAGPGAGRGPGAVPGRSRPTESREPQPCRGGGRGRDGRDGTGGTGLCPAPPGWSPRRLARGGQRLVSSRSPVPAAAPGSEAPSPVPRSSPRRTGRGFSSAVPARCRLPPPDLEQLPHRTCPCVRPCTGTCPAGPLVPASPTHSVRAAQDCFVLHVTHLLANVRLLFAFSHTVLSC